MAVRFPNGLKTLWEKDELLVTTLVLMLPMYHAYGLYLLTANGHSMGANVVVMSKFTPDFYLELIQKYKVSF